VHKWTLEERKSLSCIIAIWSVDASNTYTYIILPNPPWFDLEFSCVNLISWINSSMEEIVHMPLTICGVEYWLLFCVDSLKWLFPICGYECLAKVLRAYCLDAVSPPYCPWHTVLLLSFLGLLITYVALNLMDGHGQPALLYIVPFTIGKWCLAPWWYYQCRSISCHVFWIGSFFVFVLTNYQICAGTFIALGMKRGELRNLWTKGHPERVCTHMHTHPSPKDSPVAVSSTS